MTRLVGWCEECESSYYLDESDASPEMEETYCSKKCEEL